MPRSLDPLGVSLPPIRCRGHQAPCPHRLVTRPTLVGVHRYSHFSPGASRLTSDDAHRLRAYPTVTGGALSKLAITPTTRGTAVRCEAALVPIVDALRSPSAFARLFDGHQIAGALIHQRRCAVTPTCRRHWSSCRVGNASQHFLLRCQRHSGGRFYIEQYFH